MFFVAVGFSDAKVARTFELMRLVCEPDAARSAHITLRGPYAKKGNIKRSMLEKDVGRISVLPPRNFFSSEGSMDQQNTVFLGVSVVGIDDFWYKPDYPDGTPHLTIYDGKDRQFAWGVFSTLKRHSWRFFANTTPMQILEKKRAPETAYLLEMDPYRSILDQVFSRGITIEAIKALSPVDRLSALNRLCHVVHDLTRPSLGRK